MAYATATLTSTNDYVQFSPAGKNGVLFFVDYIGTTTGTITAERSVDGTNFRNLIAFTSEPTETQKIHASDGVYRVRATTISGSIFVEASDA